MQYYSLKDKPGKVDDSVYTVVTMVTIGGRVVAQEEVHRDLEDYSCGSCFKFTLNMMMHSSLV